MFLGYVIAWMIAGAIVGCIIGDWTDPKGKNFLVHLVITFLIFFLFGGIGYSTGELIFADELELANVEWECEVICDDNNLEYADYIAGECLCRGVSQDFTLVNGEVSDG